MIKLVRRLRDQYDIGPKDIYNFDEIRIYSSPQDLHSQTLEFQSVRDPYAKKIQNPKEAYTGMFGNVVKEMKLLNARLPDDSIKWCTSSNSKCYVAGEN